MSDVQGAPSVRVDSEWYLKWRAKLLSDPKTRATYQQEAAKKELWLQLVEARIAAGFTQAQLAKRLGVSQAQVARVEQRGYDSYTLKTLRRYVEALGTGYSVNVQIVNGAPEFARPVRPARVTR